MQRIRPAFFIAFFFFSYSIQAQENLIANGDFEIYSSCPTDFSQPTDYQINKCTGWTAPTYGTSDYYNECALSLVGVPTNIAGTQTAFNGSAYCGFVAYNASGGEGCNYTGDYWFEYVQGHFTEPLVAGRIYEIGFNVSLAEDLSNVAVGELGCFISNTEVTSCNTLSLPVVPQITGNNGYLDDDANWTTISGYYLAQGGEEYVTIGNFKDSASTNIKTILNNGSPELAYYFVDGVFARDVSDNSSNVFTPNNDGINDVWSLAYSSQNIHSKISILNRWGNVITEGDLSNFQWDGKTPDGKECSDGIYFFRISNTNIAGFIQLIR